MTQLATLTSGFLFVCLYLGRTQTLLKSSQGQHGQMDPGHVHWYPLAAAAKMSRRKISKNEVSMSYIDMFCKNGCGCPHHLPLQDGRWWWLSEPWMNLLHQVLQHNIYLFAPDKFHHRDHQGGTWNPSLQGPHGWACLCLGLKQDPPSSHYPTDSGKMKIISSSHYPSREGISCH